MNPYHRKPRYLLYSRESETKKKENVAKKVEETKALEIQEGALQLEAISRYRGGIAGTFGPIIIYHFGTPYFASDVLTIG